MEDKDGEKKEREKEQTKSLFGQQEFTKSEKEEIESLLKQKLGKTYVTERKGAGGGNFTYVESWRAIELANDIFSYNGWSSSVVDITPDFIEESPGRVRVGVSAVVKVMLKDGTFHEDVGYGCAENPKKGTAIEFAKKEAVSDARKRALRIFGSALGNCLYDKEHLKKIKTNREDETYLNLSNKKKNTINLVVPPVGGIPVKNEPQTGANQNQKPNMKPINVVKTPSNIPQMNRSVNQTTESQYKPNSMANKTSSVAQPQQTPQRSQPHMGLSNLPNGNGVPNVGVNVNTGGNNNNVSQYDIGGLDDETLLSLAASVEERPNTSTCDTFVTAYEKQVSSINANEDYLDDLWMLQEFNEAVGGGVGGSGSTSTGSSVGCVGGVNSNQNFQHPPPSTFNQNKSSPSTSSTPSQTNSFSSSPNQNLNKVSSSSPPNQNQTKLSSPPNQNQNKFSSPPNQNHNLPPPTVNQLPNKLFTSSPPNIVKTESK